jgi:hypothetical protein
MYLAFVIFSQHLVEVNVRAAGAATGLENTSRTEKEEVRSLGAMTRKTRAFPLGSDEKLEGLKAAQFGLGRVRKRTGCEAGTTIWFVETDPRACDR